MNGFIFLLAHLGTALEARFYFGFVMTLEQFWRSCLHHLHHTLPAQAYESWIVPLRVGEEGKDWVIYAPSVFASKMVRHQYEPQIQALLPEGAPVLRVAIGANKGQHYGLPENQPQMAQSQIERVSETEKVPLRGSKSKAIDGQKAGKLSAKERIGKMRQTALAQQKSPVGASDEAKPEKKAASSDKGQAGAAYESGLSPDYTFDSLVDGQGNQVAVAVARAIVDKPGKHYNPFFIYGKTGLGKTHLAQAVGNELLRREPHSRVKYIHANDYVQAVMNAYQKKDFASLKNRYKNYDLLIIDDIQFITGKDRTMEEFFHLYNHFHHQNQQIILTCDTLPTDIVDMDDRLKSRFSWGLTEMIQPPELEMRVAILQKKAELSHIELEESVAFYIANLIRSNVRELEGAFKSVEARAKFLHKKIDMDLAREALQNIAVSKTRHITPQLIIDEVAKYYRIKVSDLTGSGRKKMIVRPRQIAMHLCKTLTTESLASIGEAFGGKDHTTVLNAVRKIDMLKASDAEVAQDYDKLLIVIRD